MNYQRFSYNYQIPYQPFYQRARQELEQGITILQEKIKLKKQLEVQRQMQQKLIRISEIEDGLKYDRALHEIDNKQQLQRQYSNQQLKLPLDRSNHTTQEQVRTRVDMNESGKKHPINIQDISQIQTPQRQRMQTIPQKSVEKSSISISSNNAQAKPSNKQNLLLPPISENQDNFITHRQQNDVQKVHLYQTPIHLLGRASNSKQRPIKYSQLVSPIKEEILQAKQFIRTEYTPSKSGQLFSTFTQLDFSTGKPTSKLNRSKSMRQQRQGGTLLATSEKRPQQLSNKKVHKKQNVMALLKQSALQKVKNRIKVSSIYTESHFSNNKNEIARLFSTFESELASRKQIILKICKAEHLKLPSN